MYDAQFTYRHPDMVVVTLNVTDHAIWGIVLFCPSKIL
jgi:hypothetical protein